MLPQFLENFFRTFNPFTMFSSVVALALAALELYAWRRVTNRSLKKNDEPASKGAKPIWPPKTSTVLILTSAPVLVDSALDHPPFDLKMALRLSLLLFLWRLAYFASGKTKADASSIAPKPSVAARWAESRNRDRLHSLIKSSRITI